MRTCPYCDISFEPAHALRKYCTERCARRANWKLRLARYGRKQRDPSVFPVIPEAKARLRAFLDQNLKHSAWDTRTI